MLVYNFSTEWKKNSYKAEFQSNLVAWDRLTERLDNALWDSIYYVPNKESYAIRRLTLVVRSQGLGLGKVPSSDHLSAFLTATANEKEASRLLWRLVSLGQLFSWEMFYLSLSSKHAIHQLVFETEPAGSQQWKDLETNLHVVRESQWMHNRYFGVWVHTDQKHSGGSVEAVVLQWESRGVWVF